MRKKYLVVGSVILILFFLTSITSAYSIDRVLTQALGVKGLLYADWQMDYYLPMNPEDLDRGDYRISANMGRVDLNSEPTDLFRFSEGGEAFNNYFLALDTGITDNVSMRLSYDYAPFVDDNEDESTNKIYSAYFNYSMENDKNLYFGYNRLNYDYKDKTELYESNLTAEYYFIGFEMKGSFLGKNDKE